MHQQSSDESHIFFEGKLVSIKDELLLIENDLLDKWLNSLITEAAKDHLDCVDIGNILAICNDPEKVLKRLWMVCHQNQIALIFEMPNIFHIGSFFSQYFQEDIQNPERRMSKWSIENLLEKTGFAIEDIDEICSCETADLPDSSSDIILAAKHYTGLTASGNIAEKFKIRCKAVERKADTGSYESRPFLSVIIRTTGNRIQELKEVLLCLSGQINQHFEVFLMLHNVSEDRKKIIYSILDSLTNQDRMKYNIVDVLGGSRSRPLNVAIDHLNGLYFSILDDDDLVFADWVDAFQERSGDSSGRVLHCFAVSQNWSKDTQGVIRSVGPFDYYYCQRFDWNVQCKNNRCPLMTLAFPTLSVRKLAFRFDDSLNVAEDWDFLMRVASVLGVTDVERCTAVYRKWQDAENSLSLYSRDQWSASEHRVKAGFCALRRIVDVSEYMEEWEAISCTSNRGPAGITEHELRYRDRLVYGRLNRLSSKRCRITFDESIFIESNCTLRIDPFNLGGFRMLSPVIELWYNTGQMVSYAGKMIKSNGVRNRDEIVFCFTDPQLFIHVEPGWVVRLDISFEREDDISVQAGLKLMPAYCLKLVSGSFMRFLCFTK